MKYHVRLSHKNGLLSQKQQKQKVFNLLYCLISFVLQTIKNGISVAVLVSPHISDRTLEILFVSQIFRKQRLKMDKEWGQAHPFELNTGKTIHCVDGNYIASDWTCPCMPRDSNTNSYVETWTHFMQQVMPTFQKRSALHVVFSQRVGNIPILSILSLSEY